MRMPGKPILPIPEEEFAKLASVLYYTNEFPFHENLDYPIMNELEDGE